MLNLYHIKRVEFLGRKHVPILMQDQNGPCPLLAIANILFLSNRIAIQDTQEMISVSNLIELLAGHLFDGNPDRGEENQQKLLQDSVELLPKLARGLDVNVKFSDVSSFEFDQSIGIFDMFGTNLYHGWVIDPTDPHFGSLCSYSYNVLVEQMDNQVSKEFLHQTQSQFTYFGLTQLHERVKDRELAVFFRNNHFSVLFKFESHLYLLCTDEAFLSNTAILWERLGDIDGNTELCSPVFGDPNQYLASQWSPPPLIPPASYEELSRFYAKFAPDRNNPDFILPVLESHYDRPTLNSLLRDKYGQDLDSPLPLAPSPPLPPPPPLAKVEESTTTCTLS